MIGTSFQEIGADNALSVQDIKAKGLVGVDWTFATEAGDQLMIWDSSSQAYLTTFLYAGDEDPDGTMAAFGAEPGTWFDMGTFATADYDFANGDAFWIVSSADAASVTIAGEVPTTASEITLRPGFNMIANPYPVSVPVNDLISVSGLTGVDWTFATEVGDTLMIWDPSAQAYLTTLNYTGDDDPEGIMAAFGAEPGTFFDMSLFETATTEIPVGGAFWILSSGTGKVSFKK